MLQRLRPYNTLRNQIFIGFVFVMIIMVAVAGSMVYEKASALLKNSAERHIQQTAVQASGRMDALIGQIESLMSQASNQSTVQNLLLDEANGKPVTFNQRQSLLQVLSTYQSYLPGVGSFELYTADYQLMFPIRDGSLTMRMSQSAIRQANLAKGRVVWIGVDPQDNQSLLAVKRISLLDRWFSNGGYLVARMQRSYFQLSDPAQPAGRETILLANDEGVQLGGKGQGADLSELLAAGQTVQYEGEEQVIVRQYSEKTRWTLIVLTPVRYATEGITALRTAMFLSGAIGTLLFLIMSFLLSTLITRPIMKLIRAMRKSRLGQLTPNPDKTSMMELRELNHSYNSMVAHIDELIRVVYEKELLQSRTELKALQAQINPHFLFNTLEAFNWALEDRGETELAGFVVTMSRLFRYNIGRPGAAGLEEWVTLREECEHVERYMQIMEMRLGDRLEWEIAMETDTGSIPVPKLMIQPIVENAILHGVEGRIGRGRIAIEVKAAECSGWTRITVTDNGSGMDEPALRALQDSLNGGPAHAAKGTGVGLVNVQQRLKLYYGRSFREGMESGLQVESAPGKGTKVWFEIPNDGGAYL
ncbi:cache domain-containing sensor histidine kinase [Paenibacillus glufosinatiresistens]|uniref:cache domain-containing sensor histidine kinase n=1 Tax=Paenibacillus glufosinatiresistens TaxID=3070657 RepID=UPI00286DCE2C|nr:sensor histidine kinase [Paenibacillus sp. YX.27]